MIDSITKHPADTRATANEAPPADSEASGSPLEMGGIQLSSNKIRNAKH